MDQLSIQKQIELQQNNFKRVTNQIEWESIARVRLDNDQDRFESNERITELRIKRQAIDDKIQELQKQL